MQIFPSPGTELAGNLACYRIEKEIARGGMGAIYQARNLADQSLVAIKTACLDPEICRDERDKLRHQLIQQEEALAHLEHPISPAFSSTFQPSTTNSW